MEIDVNILKKLLRAKVHYLEKQVKKHHYLEGEVTGAWKESAN